MHVVPQASRHYFLDLNDSLGVLAITQVPVPLGIISRPYKVPELFRIGAQDSRDHFWALSDSLGPWVEHTVSSVLEGT